MAVKKINKLNNDLLKNGFVILKNCSNIKINEDLKKSINSKLKSILKIKKVKFSNNLSSNFLKSINYYSQHFVQSILAKELVKNDLVKNFLLQDKILDSLISLLGNDLEYETNFELSINVKNEKDEYLVKKYHQEFWSGVGINSLLLWIPVYLLPGMGTIELIKYSHRWGHIPHRNREPIAIPENSKVINPKNLTEKDFLIFTSLTLHRTQQNKHNIPRFAMPVVVRNFNYQKTGNEDLMNFEILNMSFVSKFRKILGNPHYSPFRTEGSERKII